MNHISLRPYQRDALDSVWSWLHNNDGNCLASIATGGGKSLCMGTFIKEACDIYPGTRVMYLAHIKELLEQNMKALISVWPQAPVGLWSAGLGSKTKSQITVAGIQSVHRHPAKFAPIDICIIDECHLIPKSGNGMYLRFLDGLRKYNPNMRVVGWSATPFRTDTGLLTEGDDRLFHGIAYETDLGEMIKAGWLCPIVSKGSATKADLSGVHTRGGDYVPGELALAMDKSNLINGALDEIDRYAHDRKHILTFCSGVEHAKHVAEAAMSRGISASYVSGDMPVAQRDKAINDFKEGRTRILANANILTIGFDMPSVDCIVLLRPTKSAGLYIQIVGRGLRNHPSKENTLFLDFTDTAHRFGPIDCIKIKSKRAKGEDVVSVSPVKECPSCHELIHTSVMECPGCGHIWERAPSHGTEATDAVIVAALEKPREMVVTDVEYSRYEKPLKPPSLQVTYWCGPSSFKSWIPIEDERPYVKKHAISFFWKRGMMCPATVDDAVAQAMKIPRPETITVKADGKYFKVIDERFDLNKRTAA